MRKRTLFYVAIFIWGANLCGRADEIHAVIRSGDTARLEKLLAGGLSPDQRDAHGDTLLMRAAVYAPADMLKALLRKGADVNAASQDGATALMRAAGDTAKIRLLVESGADVNARSRLGNTPLILAARAHGSAPAAERLLQKGAIIGATNNFGANAIMSAAASGDLETMRLLLAKGADVNSHSRGSQDVALWGGGRSPLAWAAARGDLAMMKLLLKAGADVNSEEGFGAALTQAAWMDQREAARLLLRNGADVNAKDRLSGFTALHWAASSEKSNAALVQLLLENGANPNAEGGEPVDAYLGVPQTPLLLARKRGETAIVRALLAAGGAGQNIPEKGTPVALPDVPNTIAPNELKAGIDRSVPGLLKTAVSSKAAFLNHASRQDCVSCHQQYSPMTAFAFARAAGRPIDRSAEERLFEMARRSDTNFFALDMETTFHPEPVHSFGYALLAYGLQKLPSSPEIDAMVHHLRVIQGKDGRWHNNLPRPPIQTSDVSATALGIYGLVAYGFPAQKAEFDQRIARARAWLRQVKPENTEERAYQILGLAWSGELAGKLEKFTRALTQEQRENGGWAQLPNLASDAYATGQALFALHKAGVKRTVPAFQRGLRFLLATQREDGSWFVARRAFPFQPTMPSGYSHGRDGWISAAGSSWAVVALSLGLEENKLQASSAP